QAEDGIRDFHVTGVQTCALPIYLSLEAFERAAPATPGTGAPLPLAICDHRNILLPNAPARAAGIAPGMRRASAQALLPTLRLIERDPAREQAALASLGNWALQFTPSVSFPQAPPPRGRESPGLVLEIEPSLRLFGGAQSLLARARSGLDLLGYRATSAIAPTA